MFMLMFAMAYPLACLFEGDIGESMALIIFGISDSLSCVICASYAYKFMIRQTSSAWAEELRNLIHGELTGHAMRT
jgi:hypothetical protein